MLVCTAWNVCPAGLAHATWRTRVSCVLPVRALISASLVLGSKAWIIRRCGECTSSNRISFILAASKVFDEQLGAMLASLKYYYKHTIIAMSSPNPRLFFLLFHLKNCWNVNKSPYFYRFVPSTVICVVVNYLS